MNTAFRTTAEDPLSAARTGLLETPHGTVETPAFMPVGSQGTVKGLTHAQVEALGAQIILVNSYHLFLRPGIDAVAAMGGLHSFISWPKPILTDSGGFQIYSLSPHGRATRGSGSPPISTAPRSSSNPRTSSTSRSGWGPTS
jgi:queuine tRNA-ribosyltransferase